MRRWTLVVVLSGFALALPAPVSAQGYLVPHIGLDVGGSAGNCPSLLNDCQEERSSYGVTFGALAHGKSPSVGANAVLTAMGNLVISVPAGPFRPFLTGGIGLVRTRLDLVLTSSSEDFSANNFGYNFGGGVMVLLPAHLGIRGDIRYIRSASDVSILGISLANSAVNFTRVSVGLVIH
jgi:opacity protein-like surface antigen